MQKCAPRPPPAVKSHRTLDVCEKKSTRTETVGEQFAERSKTNARYAQKPPRAKNQGTKHSYSRSSIYSPTPILSPLTYLKVSQSYPFSYISYPSGDCVVAPNRGHLGTWAGVAPNRATVGAVASATGTRRKQRKASSHPFLCDLERAVRPSLRKQLHVTWTPRPVRHP